MSHPDLNNSTEKLLDTIRSGSGQAPPPQVIPPDQSPNQAVSLNSRIKKGLTAGVFIGRDHLSLALMGREKARAAAKVVKWSQIKMSQGLDLENPDLPGFLKVSVNQFLDPHKKVEIWTCLDADHLKLRTIELPDLPTARVANAAYWGLKKEVELDENKEVFDYKVLGSFQKGGVKKLNVLAYAGDADRIQRLKSVFSRAGLALKGITAFPFAMQNLILNSRTNGSSPSAAMVHIDRDYSEIACFAKGNILLSRHIRTGVSNLLREYHEYSEGGGMDGETLDLEFLSTLTDPAGEDFRCMSQASQRLTGRISATGDYFNHHLSPDQPIETYYLTGELDDCPAFHKFAGAQLQGKLKPFTPFDDMGDTLNIRMPKTPSQRAGVIPAMGIALSTRKETPNFLYTHLEKSVELKYRRYNQVIVAAGLACLLVCAWAWYAMNQKTQDHLRAVQSLEGQISKYAPVVNQPMVDIQVKKAREKARAVTRYVQDYQALAVIQELTALTPDKIRITQMDTRLSLPGSKAEDVPKADEKAPQKTLTLKGVVVDEFNALESTLTGYVIKLGDSPMFKEIRLADKKIEKQGEASILTFTADMEIL